MTDERSIFSDLPLDRTVAANTLHDVDLWVMQHCAEFRTRKEKLMKRWLTEREGSYTFTNSQGDTRELDFHRSPQMS